MFLVLGRCFFSFIAEKMLFTCETCKGTYTQKTNFYRHRKTCQVASKIYPCDKCDRVYKRRDNLKEHHKRSHGKLYKIPRKSERPVGELVDPQITVEMPRQIKQKTNKPLPTIPLLPPPLSPLPSTPPLSLVPSMPLDLSVPLKSPDLPVPAASPVYSWISDANEIETENNVCGGNLPSIQAVASPAGVPDIISTPIIRPAALHPRGSYPEVPYPCLERFHRTIIYPNGVTVHEDITRDTRSLPKRSFQTQTAIQMVDSETSYAPPMLPEPVAPRRPTVNFSTQTTPGIWVCTDIDCSNCHGSGNHASICMDN